MWESAKFFATYEDDAFMYIVIECAPIKPRGRNLNAVTMTFLLFQI